VLQFLDAPNDRSCGRHDQSQVVQVLQQVQHLDPTSLTKLEVTRKNGLHKRLLRSRGVLKDQAGAECATAGTRAEARQYCLPLLHRFVAHPLRSVLLPNVLHSNT
jgi:hypothetical protein